MIGCPPLALLSGVLGAGMGALVALLWARFRMEELRAIVIHWQEKAVYWEDQASSKLRDQSELAQDLSPEDGPST